MKRDRSPNVIDDSRDDLSWAYELERKVKAKHRAKLKATKAKVSLKAKANKKLVLADA